MGYFTLFLCFGFLVFVAAWWLGKELIEALVVGVCTFIIPSMVIIIGMASQTSDTEIWNGKVVGKEQERVSCSHSYSCNCRTYQSCTGSGASRSCSNQTTCDTCYDHNNDYDWVVKTTIGNFEIDRMDRQGVLEPKRYTMVKVNDPVAKTHTFTNYIKAARNNVFNRAGTTITYPIPSYPTKIYDYYKIDRVVDLDGLVANANDWNTEISNILRDLGSAKQVNVVMVFTKHPEPFADQLNAAWLGGKKNDVIIVMGVQANKAEWVKVLSWTKHEDFKVELRDALLETEFSPKSVMDVVGKIITAKFDRRQMQEFEYLKYGIEPSELNLWIALVLLILPSLVYGYYLRTNRFTSQFWR